MKHPFSGSELRNAGMQVAIDHANLINEHWSDDAYDVLTRYVKSHIGKFMCEDVRQYAMSNALLAEPPNNRAWGHVIAKAAREGLIVHAGFANVSNPKAHRTPASLWERLV